MNETLYVFLCPDVVKKYKNLWPDSNFLQKLDLVNKQKSYILKKIPKNIELEFKNGTNINNCITCLHFSISFCKNSCEQCYGNRGLIWKKSIPKLTYFYTFNKII